MTELVTPRVVDAFAAVEIAMPHDVRLLVTAAYYLGRRHARENVARPWGGPFYKAVFDGALRHDLEIDLGVAAWRAQKSIARHDEA